MGIFDILDFGNIEKKTGQKYQSFVVPALSVPGGGIAKTALAIGGGALAGFGLSSLFGGGSTSKKEAALTAAPQSIAATITPNVVTTTTTLTNTYNQYNQQDYSTNIISNSPYGSISKKQEAMSSVTPSVGVSTEIPISATGEQGQDLSAAQADGTNMALLAGIAAVGLIGYGYVSRKKT
jgi:hypothetical protein